MSTVVTLYAGALRYPPGFALHTASSGRITELEELYLVVVRDGKLVALGEIRENVQYLTGVVPATVREGVGALIESLNWSLDRSAIADQFDRAEASRLPIARALLDSALVDWSAREHGITVAELFGGSFQSAHDTNQTLFLGDNTTLLANAETYIARGFHKLKLRVGALAFAEDCRRLELLRNHFGDRIELAVDANGAWSPDEVAEHLRALARFDLAYVEQPIAPGDWQVMERIGTESPVPVMLDESLSSPTAVERVIAVGGALWAHLKIIKMGGITPTIRAGQRLAAAGIPFMIGQMNEGAAATAAAFHCAVATRPAFAELYGADGLVNDPVSGVKYAQGAVHIEHAPGLGVQIDTHSLKALLEITA